MDLTPQCVLTKGGAAVMVLTLRDIHGNGRRNSGWVNDANPDQTFWNLREVRSFAKAHGLRVTRRPAI